MQGLGSIVNATEFNLKIFRRVAKATCNFTLS